MKKLMFLFLLLLCVTFCTRDKLIIGDCSCTDMAKLPISVNWTRSKLKPQNISVLFYDSEKGDLVKEHQMRNIGDSAIQYIHMPIGRYTVVVFNELRNQILNVRVVGHEKFSTLQFVGIDESPEDVVSRSKDARYILSPEEFGTVIVNDVEVTKDLISYTHGVETKADVATKNKSKETSKKLLGLSPLNRISWLDIKLHIKGLINARMPGLVDLRELSDGYIPATDRNTKNYVTEQFSINNRKFDPDSTRDGTVSARIAIFGLCDERNNVTYYKKNKVPLEIDVLFMLRDKEKTLINQKIDIVDLITFDQSSSSASGVIELQVDFELPEPLPYVKPESEEESGFGSSVVDWEVVDVPL